jgi:drug/metabolite transporter (DMT)-like permease
MVAQGLAGGLGVLVVAATGRLPRSLSLYRSKAFLLRLSLFVSHVMCVYAAVQLVETQAMPGVVFCNYLWPTLALLWSIRLTSIRIPRPWLFSLGIALATLALALEFGGSMLSFAASGNNGIAFVIAIFGANAWGLYSAVTRKWGDVSGGSAVTPLFLLACGGIAAITSGLNAILSAATDVLQLPPAAVAVGICNFIAYLCWDVGIRKGNPVSLTMLSDLIPWLSLAAVSVFLHIAIANSTVVSALVLVAGGMLARFGTMQSRR